MLIVECLVINIDFHLSGQENYLRKGKARMIWNDYRRLKDIHAFMDELEVDYPSICTGGIIGQSLECRPLKVPLIL